MNSSYLVKLKKQSPTTVVASSLLLISISCLLFFLYAYLLQIVTILLATFMGSLCAFFFLKFQTKKNEKQQQIQALSRTGHILHLYRACNEQFKSHLKDREHLSLPWEKTMNFYEFALLPVLDLNSLTFFQYNESGKAMEQQLLNLLNSIKTINTALKNLNRLHYLHLDKLNLWESRIKTLKGVKQMQISDVTLLKEKIGASFVNELLFLNELIMKNSSNLEHLSNQLISQLQIKTYS